MPRPSRPSARPLLLLALALLAAAAPAAPALAARVVVIDAGHGGRGEGPGPFTGDSWDPAKRAFQNPYNYGAAHADGDLHEQRIVLDVALRVRDLLERAATAEGFPAFKRLLARYGRPRGDAFPRPDIRIVMARTDSFESPERATLREVNRFYRLYDGPTGFRDDDKPHPDLYPGRMSLINRAKPELCVSIHINAAKDAARRGQASVVTPNGRLFGFLRDLSADLSARHGEKAANATLARLDWYFHRTPILGNLGSLARDAATYFDAGGNAPRRDRVTWKHKKDSRSFAERERGTMESYRRGGDASLGGDNLEAGDEILRFVRSALARAILAEQPAATRGRPADELLGPHGPPFARDYALPLFIHAVSAYLELGYLTNAADRALLARHPDAYAEGIAVGIYSLLYGMVPHEEQAAGVTDLEPPRGRPIDFRKYRRGRDYFTEVFPKRCEIPERVLAFREHFEVMPSAKIRAEGAPAPPARAVEPKPPAAKVESIPKGKGKQPKIVKKPAKQIIKPPAGKKKSPAKPQARNKK